MKIKTQIETPETIYSGRQSETTNILDGIQLQKIDLSTHFLKIVTPL